MNGQIFVGNPDGGEFKPLGYLSNEGVTVEGSPYDNTKKAITKFEETFIRVKLEITENFRLAFMGPPNWMVFQGSATEQWWSIPKDNRCDGGIFGTKREAVNFALFMAKWLDDANDSVQLDGRIGTNSPGDEWFCAPHWLMLRVHHLRIGDGYRMYLRVPQDRSKENPS